ncbi:MAG: hypothetical protein AB8F95_15225, partial [Bacteroidia bacterium]
AQIPPKPPVPEPVQKREEKPTTTPPVEVTHTPPPTEEKPVTPAPTPQPAAPTESPQAAAISEEPKPANSPRKGLGGLANLDLIKSQAKEAALIANSQDSSAKEKIYEVDHSITIPESNFKHALDSYVSVLLTSGKTILATALQNPQFTLTANKWTLTLTNQLLPDLVQRETKLLPYLREKLQVPNLFLEVVIDESYVNPQDSKPYTDEEKLSAMKQKNPTVDDLLIAFKTRIAYE